MGFFRFIWWHLFPAPPLRMFQLFMQCVQNSADWGAAWQSQLALAVQGSERTQNQIRSSVSQRMNVGIHLCACLFLQKPIASVGFMAILDVQFSVLFFEHALLCSCVLGRGELAKCPILGIQLALRAALFLDSSTDCKEESMLELARQGKI